MKLFNKKMISKILTCVIKYLSAATAFVLYGDAEHLGIIRGYCHSRCYLFITDFTEKYINFLFSGQIFRCPYCLNTITFTRDVTMETARKSRSRKSNRNITISIRL